VCTALHIALPTHLDQSFNMGSRQPRRQPPATGGGTPLPRWITYKIPRHKNNNGEYGRVGQGNGWGNGSKKWSIAMFREFFYYLFWQYDTTHRFETIYRYFYDWPIPKYCQGFFQWRFFPVLLCLHCSL